MADPSSNEPAAPPPLLGARKTLADLEAALIDQKNGLSPRVALVELARRLAYDLAGYVDDFPTRAFTGHLARAQGPIRHVLPVREVRHRLLLGRYRQVGPWYRQPLDRSRSFVTVGVVAIGVDGVLRRGLWHGYVLLPNADTALPTDPLRAAHALLNGIPKGPIALDDWTGTSDPIDVASPSEVIVALKEIAGTLAAANARDLEVLRQHL
jgi:hypothetical protein